MNLRAAANLLTRSVNPNIVASWQKSTGYSQGDDFEAVPTYAAAVDLTIQKQALTMKEVEHLDALNITGSDSSVYANAQLRPVDRVKQTGGDLLSFLDPETGEQSTWLVVAILEAWGLGSWCKAAVVKQMP